jgi:CTP:molybdopterin cytidylyltransferase MocA
MASLGSLLDEAHASLRDRYSLSTPEVEALRDAIRVDPSVLGARLMGGGFGGNVLALVHQEGTDAVIERAQSGYYRPRGRDGIAAGEILVSTPGAGVSRLDLEAAAAQAVTALAARGVQAEAHRRGVSALLDAVADAGLNEEPVDVWPVIVAAGRGQRAKASGLLVPKFLAPVMGVPSVLRTIATIRAAAPGARTPIVVVSADTEAAMRRELAHETVEFAVQRVPRGTGDAVRCARGRLLGHTGWTLVVWGTQPVIRVETLRRALTIARICGDHAMVFPTVVTETPYAPLQRDARGRVTGSRETHLESAPSERLGETNIGLFLVRTQLMIEALDELRRTLWREPDERYDRPGGELGFPNEIVPELARRTGRVLAIPLADPREAQGIKTGADVATCERFIRELAMLR